MPDPPKHYRSPYLPPKQERSREQRNAERATDQRRGSPTSRGYNYRWTKARKVYLKQHPLCVNCERQGRIEPANVVDHIIDHKGDMELFWDSGNWQALCKPCHDHKTTTGHARRVESDEFRVRHEQATRCNATAQKGYWPT